MKPECNKTVKIAFSENDYKTIKEYLASDHDYSSIIFDHKDNNQVYFGVKHRGSDTYKSFLITFSDADISSLNSEVFRSVFHYTAMEFEYQEPNLLLIGCKDCFPIDHMWELPSSICIDAKEITLNFDYETYWKKEWEKIEEEIKNDGTLERWEKYDNK